MKNLILFSLVMTMVIIMSCNDENPCDCPDENFAKKTDTVKVDTLVKTTTQDRFK